MSMAITEDTSLLDAFMARDDLFDRLVRLDAKLSKFYRVLVNEEVAGRLTLGDAAAILGIAADDLARLARGEDVETLRHDPAPRDRLEVLDVEDVAVLDTRPIFERGFEPLPAILDAVEALAPDQGLLVQAPFHPVPLRRFLARRGYASVARERGGAWEIIFAKP